MSFEHRSGFALPAVLAVTGVVTLIFLVAITALTSLTREARSTRERVGFVESALSAEATLQYLALTEPFGTQGINPGGARMRSFGEDGGVDPIASSGGSTPPVLLDGTRYQIEAEGVRSHPVVASLRDQAGMINLARLNQDQLGRFAGSVGSPVAVGRNLPALYADYVDADDLETMNGAESTRYDNRGPANRYMLRPSEFLSVLGMRESVDQARWRDIWDDLTVDHRRANMNLNTASPRTLMILFGISEQQAQAAVRARKAAPFLSLADFIAASGANIPYDGEQIYTFPAGRIVYLLTDTRSAWRYRARLILTPTGLERPFWVDQTEMTEASGTAMASADATRFPYTPR